MDAGSPQQPSSAGDAAGGTGYSVADIRDEHAQACVQWDAALDDELRTHFRAGWSVEDIARLMQRQSGGIQSRVEKQGLK